MKLLLTICLAFSFCTVFPAVHGQATSVMTVVLQSTYTKGAISTDTVAPSSTMSSPIIAVMSGTPTGYTNTTDGDTGIDNGYTAPTGNEGGASGSDQGNRGISTGAMSAIIVVIVLVVVLGGECTQLSRKAYPLTIHQPHQPSSG